MNFIKSVTDSGWWLAAKIIFTVIMCTLGFKTIQISFFGYFVMGAEIFLKWNFWANTGLGLVLFGFGVVLVASSWNSIKKRFARKD